MKRGVIVKGLLVILFLLKCALVHADIYRKPVPSLPITFDPKFYSDAYSALVSGQIYDRLFEFDELQNIKPNLAEKWETLENGKVWIVFLKTGIYFHDGKPFTAEDVEFSLRRLLQSDSVKSKELSIIAGADEYAKGRSKNVSGIKILSPQSIRIELTSPFPPFLNILASLNTEIVPKDFGGRGAAAFLKHPIGTGPFKFEEIVPNKYVALVANDKYFEGRPRLEKVIFEKCKTREAIEGFNHNYYHDLEWYFDIEPKKITTTYTVMRAPVPEVSILAFNLRRQPFNNEHIRKAISYALNKEELARECFLGRKVAAGYIPPGVGGYVADMKPQPFSLDKAKQEIKNSGVSPQVISKPITILRPDNHICAEKFKSFVENSVRKIGINATVKYVPLGELYSRNYTPRNFDIFNMIFSSDYPEALFLLNFFRSDHTDNYSGFKSRAFDELLIRASRLEDRYERYNLYKKAQEILEHDTVVIPLFYAAYENIYQQYVRGVKISPYVTYSMPMKTIYFDKGPRS